MAGALEWKNTQFVEEVERQSGTPVSFNRAPTSTKNST